MYPEHLLREEKMRLHRWALCALLLLAACSGGAPSSGPAEEASTPAAFATTPPAATEDAGAIATSAPPVAETATSTPPAVETATSEAATTDAPVLATTTVATTVAETAATVVVVPPSPIELPPGFGISVYAENLGDPRFMAYSPDGVLYVTDIGGGRVLALPDGNRDGVADATEEAITGLREPHGIAFHAGALYVGETTQIARFTRSGDGWGDKEVIVPNLPTGGHRTRTVIFGQDGKMYVSIGSSCNVCNEELPLRAAVLQYDADGSNGKLFSAGLRNAVGLMLRPGTNEIWATNNGADQMGDDVPPETVNVLADGADFGWPRCHAGHIVDPQFGGQGGCDGVRAPAVEMQAHSAPLGLRFYEGQMFPAEYRGNLFIAFHGSWNRSTPTGYNVVRVQVDAAGRPGAVQDFAGGWLRPDGRVAGRPVDVIVAPDGALLVSDDSGGRIFRIFYHGS